MRNAILVSLFLPVICLGQGVFQETCCPSGGAAVGVSFSAGGTPWISARFWMTQSSALDVGVANPFNFDTLYFASVRVIRDFCSLRPYISAGVTLPVRYNYWWISGWAGLGVEWCIPGLEDLALSLSFGGSATYCLCCGPWYSPSYCWTWGTAFLFSIWYYLPPLGGGR